MLFPTYLPVTLSTWLYEFMPRIRELLGLPNDDSDVIDYFSSQGIESGVLDMDTIFHYNRTICFGASPELEECNLDQITDRSRGINIISADGATRFLFEHRIRPDLVVTDLDGIDESLFQELVETRIPLQILTHGDNMVVTERYLNSVQDFSDIALVTQDRPANSWSNTFGFTDGDRSVSIASKYSKSVYLIGFNLNSTKIGKYSKPNFYHHQKLTTRKRTKLQIASEVISWLSKRGNIYTPSYKYSPGIEISLEDFFKV